MMFVLRFYMTFNLVLVLGDAGEPGRASAGKRFSFLVLLEPV